MPSFNLPLPTTAPVDHDSLAARQARNAQQTADGTVAFLVAMRDEIGRRYTHTWGQPLPQIGADGKPILVGGQPVPNLSERRNENNLSPAESIASYGAQAQTYFGAFAALVPVAVALGVLDADGTHPLTGDDMTRPPAGWSVSFAADGTGTAAYTPPAPAPTPTPAPAA